MGKRKQRYLGERHDDGLPRIRGLAPQLTRAKGLKGSTYGPASPGRRLSDEEREVIEKKMRDEGKL